MNTSRRCYFLRQSFPAILSLCLLSGCALPGAEPAGTAESKVIEVDAPAYHEPVVVAGAAPKEEETVVIESPEAVTEPVTKAVSSSGAAEESAAAETETGRTDTGRTETSRAETNGATGAESATAETEPPESEKAGRKQAGSELPDIPGLTSFSPHCTEQTDPARMIASTEVFLNDKKLSMPEEFHPWYRMDFGDPSKYGQEKGIYTFRGNPFRDAPAYGTAALKENKLESVWTAATGILEVSGRSWTGSGWTGQPLMRRWSREMKQHMNLPDWAKNDDSMVEVIYACLDGNIYFLDLATGRPTREPMRLGFAFKGSGALDPRGLPLLYVGAGYDSSKGKSRVFIIDLIKQEVLYTFGNVDPVSQRGSLSYFDSSALVDAASDTLIYPGENGLLYLMHLNAAYDPATGTVSVNPDQVLKWRYRGKRSGGSSFWLGMEDSAAVCGGYLYIADNGGHLMCLNLNTLELVWVQDILDDSNATPVLSVEDGRLYLYISTSFHLGWRSSSTAPVPVFKIDAETGEILWQKVYTCHSSDGVSGGVQSTIAVGKNDLSNYVYVTVSKVGGQYSGVLACIDKNTGEAVWEHSAGYAWSSPVCVYRPDGSGAVIYCSSDSRMYLLDGKTGAVMDSMDLGGGNVEASPAVWGDLAVVGTRGLKIRTVRLK